MYTDTHQKMKSRTITMRQTHLPDIDLVSDSLSLPQTLRAKVPHPTCPLQVTQSSRGHLATHIMSTRGHKRFPTSNNYTGPALNSLGLKSSIGEGIYLCKTRLQGHCGEEVPFG